MSRKHPQSKAPSASRQTLEELQQFESRNVTYVAADGSWPIVWERARRNHVWDVDGRPYLDLTAAFGVAAAGHANRAVVRAGQRQMDRLLHAMGDVHPHRLKGQLARELSRLTFERWTAHTKRIHGKCIFGNSGFEAVEAALKTARLATGRPRVLAFEGAYHGLGYGTLNVTQRAHFRGGFLDQLREFADFIPFPTDPASLRLLEQRLEKLGRKASRTVGAVLVEPVQARGGMRIPPAGFLPLLRRWCDQQGALLILDEIYTGCGRTGRWFACEHHEVVPDLICLGKALTGGFPLSACVGKAAIMDAWPVTTGEAIHTSTYLGHPVGCAMALAELSEITRLDLPRRAALLGAQLLHELEAMTKSGKNGRWRLQARGVGLMAGLEFRDAQGRPATAIVVELLQRLLQRGFIFLPEGESSEVLGWTPPLTITARQLTQSVQAVAQELKTLL
jgi:4-aminobutyrate aminotransferase-like enzyme